MDSDALRRRVRRLEDELAMRFEQRDIAAVGGRVRAAIGAHGTYDPYERALTVTRDVLRLREASKRVPADAREAVMIEQVTRARRALLVVDADRIIRAISRAAAEVCAYEPLELVGINARELAADYERSDRRWEELRERGDGDWHDGSGEIVRRDGRRQRIAFGTVQCAGLYLVDIQAVGRAGPFIGRTSVALRATGAHTLVAEPLEQAA
jgi:PAS domain S-box-containing protein